MVNLLKAELYKLKTSKVFYFIVLLMVIQSVLCPILFSRSMTGKVVLIQVFGAQEFLSLSITIAVFAAYYIDMEFSSGYIKNLIAYGHKRKDIVIAKSIVYYIGIIIISLICPILITIINTVMNGYGEVFTLNSFMFILNTTVLMLLTYIGIASIAVLVSFIWRNGLVTILIFILLDPINRFGRAFSILNDNVRYIYDNTILGQSKFLCLNNISFFQEIKVIGISLITITISTLLSIYFFKKADIK